jgi:uncharacterized membrane protein
MDSYNYLFNIATFYLILAYITFFIKETKSGLNISFKSILYPAMAITFIFSGLCIGFATMLVYIIISVIILVVCLPFLRTFLEKRRNR